MTHHRGLIASLGALLAGSAFWRRQVAERPLDKVGTDRLACVTGKACAEVLLEGEADLATVATSCP